MIFDRLREKTRGDYGCGYIYIYCTYIYKYWDVWRAAKTMRHWFWVNSKDLTSRRHWNHFWLVNQYLPRLMKKPQAMGLELQNMVWNCAILPKFRVNRHCHVHKQKWWLSDFSKRCICHQQKVASREKQHVDYPVQLMRWSTRDTGCIGEHYWPPTMKDTAEQSLQINLLVASISWSSCFIFPLTHHLRNREYFHMFSIFAILMVSLSESKISTASLAAWAERQDATDAVAAANATVAASTAATATTTHVGVPKDFFFPLHMYIWICI
jgi:hypothetical protein